MRRNYIIFFLLSFGPIRLLAQNQHAYNPFIDVQHYDFTVALSDDDNEIRASAAITVVFLQATNKVTFDLIGKNNAGTGMTVTGVKENGNTVSYEHINDHLVITPLTGVKPGDTGVYNVSYTGTPADGLVFSKNKFGKRTIFGDNWPNRARNWLPCVDHLSDKASVDFMITAPEHYKVVSNGVLVEESTMEAHQKFTHWKETVPIPTKVMVIGLADFAVNYAGDVDCIPVSSWVFPQDKKNGFYYYSRAVDVLAFFTRQLGPYAYKKLANVEAITIFGGMENASAIFYNEESLNGKHGLAEDLLAHEIAHQWFGNSVTESDWPHVWLSEGFATAMSYFYLEYKYGQDSLTARLKADRQSTIQFARKRFTPIVDSSEKENYLLLLNDNSYKKAGWVLHMLRKKMGDSLFWKGIRAYYSTYARRNAGTDDLRNVMEKVSGIDLKSFFRQWLYTPGHPVLQLTWKYDEQKKAVMLRIVQQQKPLFSFPLDLALLNGGSAKNYNSQFSIKDKETLTEIPAATKPARVIADPYTNLLYEGSIKEE